MDIEDEKQMLQLEDEVQEALWAFVQLVSKKMGIKDLTSDDFNNEMLMEAAAKIIGPLKMIKHYSDNPELELKPLKNELPPFSDENG